MNGLALIHKGKHIQNYIGFEKKWCMKLQGCSDSNWFWQPCCLQNNSRHACMHCNMTLGDIMIY
jgi:hypothetical protein